MLCLATFHVVCYEFDNGVWDVCVEVLDVYCMENLAHVQSYSNCAHKSVV